MSEITEPRFWVAVAFVIFFIVFGRRLWRVIVGMLDARAAAVRAELEEAARLRQEAEAMLRDASARRDAAIRDAEALLASAQGEAARVAAAARTEAEAAGRRREQMALDRIAAAEKAAVTEVRMVAADIATRAAERVIATELTPQDDAALVDHAIGGLAAALSGRRAA